MNLWQMLRSGEIERDVVRDILIKQEGMSEEKAEFYIAMALGEINGDVIQVEANNGN